VVFAGNNTSLIWGKTLLMDFLFLGLFSHIVLSLMAAIQGTDRQIGFWGALIICLIFTPFIGIICIQVTPSNDEVARQKRMLKLLEQIAEKAVLPSAG
jgi:hypothetical protein